MCARTQNHRTMSFQNLEMTNKIFFTGISSSIFTAQLLSSFLHLKLGHLFFHMLKGFTRTWPMASHWDFSFQVFLLTSFQQFQHRHLYTLRNEASWVLKDFWVILYSTKILWRRRHLTPYITIFASAGCWWRFNAWGGNKPLNSSIVKYKYLIVYSISCSYWRKQRQS